MKHSTFVQIFEWIVRIFFIYKVQSTKLSLGRHIYTLYHFILHRFPTSTCIQYDYIICIYVNFGIINRSERKKHSIDDIGIFNRMAKRKFILYTGFSNDDHVKFEDVDCRTWIFYTQNISFYIYNRHQTRSVLHNNRAYSIFRSLRLVRVFHNTKAIEKRVKPRDEMAKKIWIWFLLMQIFIKMYVHCKLYLQVYSTSNNEYIEADKSVKHLQGDI